jgi:hypothetical protein
LSYEISIDPRSRDQPYIGLHVELEGYRLFGHTRGKKLVRMHDAVSPCPSLTGENTFLGLPSHLDYGGQQLPLCYSKEEGHSQLK